MQENLRLYEGELIEKDLVRQNQVPYMVWWVKHFLSVGKPEEAVDTSLTPLDEMRNCLGTEALKQQEFTCM